MRKLFTIFTLLSISFGFATDRFVDPNLSSGNGTTLFTSIGAAITAAQNGDRVIVAAGTYSEAAITIGKSLQIIPQNPGTTIALNTNITIAGFAGMKLEITGFNLGVYSISNSSAGTVANRAKITVIDCTAANMDFNREGFEVNAIRNTVSGQIIFKYGNMILNTVGTVYVDDESLDSPSNISEKILIAANTINNTLYFYNNDYKVVIANNTIGGYFVFKRWNANSVLKNKIINNQFTDIKLLVSAFSVPFYNLIFSNNTGNVSFYNFYHDYSSNDENNLDYNSRSDEDFIYSNYYSTTNLRFPNNGSNGIFEWSYNGVAFPKTAPSGSEPLSFINIAGTTNVTDAGNPNHDYYDPDLTVNDRGINGGPYSKLNYTASNPNNSKAFIFDLEMPSDLFPGQNVDIKAKGYHKN